MNIIKSYGYTHNKKVEQGEVLNGAKGKEPLDEKEWKIWEKNVSKKFEDAKKKNKMNRNGNIGKATFKLKKSLKENKFYFSVDDKSGKLVPATKRGELLKKLFEEDKDTFNKLTIYYDFARLEKLLMKLPLKTANAKEIKNCLQEHEKEVFKRLNDRCTEGKCALSCEERYIPMYVAEVREYFMHYFPIKKTRGKSVDEIKIMDKKKEKEVERKIYKTEYLKHYFKEKTVKETVQKQLKNQYVNQIVSAGKIYRYFCDDEGVWEKREFTSEDLKQIQRDEAFKAKILQVQQMGTMNFLNMIGRENNKKLEMVREEDFDSSYLSGFFRTNYKYQELKTIEQVLNILRVKTFHANPKKGLLEIFREIPQAIKIIKENGTLLPFVPLWESTVQRYNNELNNIDKRYIQKIASMKIGEYYKANDIKVLLENKCKFSLISDVNPIIPGFKKTFKNGLGLQDAEGNNTISRDRGWYKKFGYDNNIEKNIAYKSLLKLIYENNFLPSIFSFDENENQSKFKKLFKEGIKIVIDENERIAKEKMEKEKKINNKSKRKKSNNGESFRYKGFSNIGNESLDEYFRRIQSETMLRNQKNQKNKNEGRKEKHSDSKYEDFLVDIFAVIFNLYLEEIFKDEKSWILAPDSTLGISEQEFIDELIVEKSLDVKTLLKGITNIDNDNDEMIISLYTILKLQDNDDLSTFGHECLRYEKGMDENSETKENLKIVLSLIELIKLSQYQENFEIRNVEELNKMYDKFKWALPENLKKYNNFYYKEDGETKEFHRGIGKANYAISKNLSELYEKKFKNLSKEEDIEYLNNEELVRLQKSREEMHKEAVENKTADFDRKNYDETVDKIFAFDSARRYLTLESLYHVHKVYQKITSRFIGFAQKWERDCLFQTMYYEKEGVIPSKTTDFIFFEGRFVGEMNKQFIKYPSFLQKIKFTLENSMVIVKNKKNKDIVVWEIGDYRNKAAHLDLLKEEEDNVMGYINNFRKLFQYDRKMKNSITKSIIELLKTEGYLLKLYKKEGNYHICSLTSDVQQHLKNKYPKNPVKVDLRSTKEVEMIKLLLEKGKEQSS